METECKVLTYNKPEFGGFIKIQNNQLEVYGKIKGEFINRINKISYQAADPPRDSYSFYGSGMPYYNFEQAISNKENIGSVDVDNNEFKITMLIPNSYYDKLGTVYIEPSVFLKPDINNTYYKFVMDIGIPYRFLTHPSLNTYSSVTPKLYKPSAPEFYSCIGGLNRENRSQEQILRESEYPCDRVMPINFWGKKPAL